MKNLFPNLFSSSNDTSHKFTSREDMEYAFLAASNASQDGPISVENLHTFLSVLKETLVRDAQMICESITKSSGQPIMETYTLELMPVFLMVDALLRDIHSTPDTPELSVMFSYEGRHAKVFETARGTMLVITPKNLAFSIPMTSCIQALSCGNAVLLKPSEECLGPSIQAYALLKNALQRSGLNTDLLQCVIGNKSHVHKLCELEPDTVLFIGSNKAGTDVATTCAQRLIPCTLELGAHNHTVLTEDADIEHAARGITWGAFFSNGQTCANVSVAHVPQSQWELAITQLISTTKKLRIGDPLNPSTDVGPTCSKKTADAAQAVLEQVKNQKGVRVLFEHRQTESTNNCFVWPLIVMVDDYTHPLLHKELTAPVLVLVPYTDINSVITCINRNPYGIHASFWTTNTESTTALAKQVDCSSIYINDIGYTFLEPSLPWGGVRKSGYGNLHKHYSPTTYTSYTVIATTPYNKDLSQWWYPYSKEKITKMRQFMEHTI